MATGVGAGSLFPPPGLPPGKLGAEEGAGIFSGVNQHEIASNILSEFLEVAIHHILYIRAIYPAAFFERRHKYNIPVYMSAHPELNQYIRDVLLGFKPVLDRGQVEKVTLSIKNKDQQPVENFVFQLQGLNESALREDQHLLLLERDLRTVLLKISTSDATLKPLPPDCTFKILVHTTERAATHMEVQDAITGFPWVKVQEGEEEEGLLLWDQQATPLTTTPLKTISSSILKMQLYVDEKEDWK